jgi:hypothetical protein
MQGRAFLACARHFDKPHARLELSAMNSLVDRLKNVVAVDFLDRPTFLATEKYRPPAGWSLMKATTGEVGVFTLEAMHDPRVEKGIKSPVYGNGSQPRALLGKSIQDFVRPDAGLSRGDFLEYLATQVREPNIPFRKDRGGAVE